MVDPNSPPPAGAGAVVEPKRPPVDEADASGIDPDNPSVEGAGAAVVEPERPPPAGGPKMPPPTGAGA